MSLEGCGGPARCRVFRMHEVRCPIWKYCRACQVFSTARFLYINTPLFPPQPAVFFCFGYATFLSLSILDSKSSQSRLESTQVPSRAFLGSTLSSLLNSSQFNVKFPLELLAVQR